MKCFFLFFISLLLFTILSCKNNKSDNQALKDISDTSNQSGKTIAAQRSKILKDFETWYAYYYYNIRLSQDFVGLDVDSNKINKSYFLHQLSTGNFVPFNIPTNDSLRVYKLYALHVTDSSIKSTLQQAAQNELFNYGMEGKELPDYNFVDLNNNHYTKANTKGKTIVLKCWFIKCVACVAEFPELNKLVDEYKNKKDVLFISLAPDARENLIAFLKKKPFEYAVVPEQKTYVDEQLKFYEFPTHVLIDKSGRIVKITNSISEMIPFIKKQISE